MYVTNGRLGPEALFTRVRIFGGWDFKVEEVDRWDFAVNGYERGVPMGGDLTSAPIGKSPVFIIRALRDPDGANLDRIQIVKGWLDADGKTHEKVFDVALSDGRKADSAARLTQRGVDAMAVSVVLG